MLEIRSTGNLSSNGKTLTGYAAIYNSETDLGGFVEVLRNGCFRKSLDSGSNIRALYDHDNSALLGTTKGGTLKLAEDAHGLKFELALPDTTHGRDLAVLVDRKDVSGCSFGFRVAPGGERWDDRAGKMFRELLDVELIEITLTSNPAYADTSIAMRNMPSFWDGPVYIDLDVPNKWIETCRL